MNKENSSPNDNKPEDKNQPDCLAARYWKNRHKAWNSIRPYNDDNPNEVIFADGSKLCFGIPGQPPTVVAATHEAIVMAVMKARSRGESDRTNRRGIDPRFSKTSRSHIPIIKRAYVEGWWSIPQWPRRGK